MVDPVYTGIADHAVTPSRRHAVTPSRRHAVTPSRRQRLRSARYHMQLYDDFSEYSDMALGVARMMGIRLPINFDSPLRATGIADFYRRWHITLTRVTLTRVISRFLFSPLSIAGTRYAARRRWRGVR